MKKSSALSSLVIGAALLALSGCSGGEKKAEGAAAAETTTPVATAETAATPAVTATPVTYASLTGDAAKGEKVFLQCKACHMAEEGKNGVGPSLHAIVGRKAGQIAGFSYSAANKGSGIVWTEDKMFEYLEAPQKVVPGTKMAFAGLKKPQDRADVIAYLKTKS